MLSDAKFARGFPRCGDRRLLTWRQGRKAQPCTRGGSFYQGNNGLFGFARHGVEIAQGAKRLDQPVVVVCFPNGGIDPRCVIASRSKRPYRPRSWPGDWKAPAIWATCAGRNSVPARSPGSRRFSLPPNTACPRGPGAGSSLPNKLRRLAAQALLQVRRAFGRQPGIQGEHANHLGRILDRRELI